VAENIQAGRDHLPGIQGLRAVAAVGVMLMHTAFATVPNLQLPPIFRDVVPQLGIGVPLFFIISAYCLMHAEKRASNNPGWMTKYFIKRIFRIAPLFWFMLFIYRVLPVFQVPATPEIIVENVLFVFNFSPEAFQSLVGGGWTIGIEMPFYLCLPVIIAAVRNTRDATILFIVTSIISVSYRSWLTVHYPAPSSYPIMAFLTNIDVFAAGILAYYLIKEWGDRVSLWRWLGVAGLAVLATLPLHVGIISMLVGPGESVVMILALMAVCAWQVVSPSSALSSDPMQWLGARSFGIYLIHPFVIFTVGKFGGYVALTHWLGFIGAWSYLACVLVNAAVTIPCAGLAYILIESPGQKLGSMLIRRLHGPALKAAVPAT